MRCLLAVVICGGPAVARAASETTASDPVGIGGLVQVLLALVLVLGLIAGLAFVARRFVQMPQGGGGSLRILGGLSLGQRERMVLVQVGETQLLLGVAPGRVNTLHVLDKPISTPPAQGGERFAERLAAAMGRGGKGA